jgi:predicted hydrolase (HD superfamily)
MTAPTREEAFTLLSQYTKNESLIKHALSVEAVMRFFARKHGEDEEKWGVIGLVHDLDYDQFPEQHCTMTKRILEEKGWPPEYIRAIMSHGWGMVTDVEPVAYMEKVLYTIDELTGLVTATALVRPSKSVLDTEVKSVKKKWGQKQFAAGVSREVIEKGAAMLGMELTDIMSEVILGMREVAAQIGLEGNPGAGEG